MGPQLASEGGGGGVGNTSGDCKELPSSAKPSLVRGERGGTLKNPVLASQAAQSEEGTRLHRHDAPFYSQLCRHSLLCL